MNSSEIIICHNFHTGFSWSSHYCPLKPNLICSELGTAPCYVYTFLIAAVKMYMEYIGCLPVLVLLLLVCGSSATAALNVTDLFGTSGRAWKFTCPNNGCGVGATSIVTITNNYVGTTHQPLRVCTFSITRCLYTSSEFEFYPCFFLFATIHSARLQHTNVGFIALE